MGRDSYKKTKMGKTVIAAIGERIVELKELAAARWRANNRAWYKEQPDTRDLLNDLEREEYVTLLNQLEKLCRKQRRTRD